MAKKIVVNEEIQNFFDDWSWTGQDGKLYGYDKKRVEDAIKVQFGTKVGDIRWARNEEDSKYYDILVFDTIANAEAWDEAPDSVTPIARRMLPISTVQADSYRAILTTSKMGSNAQSPFVMKRGGSYVIPLNLAAKQIFAIDSSEQPIDTIGTVKVEKNINNAGWSTDVMTARISTTSDPDDFSQSIDIGQFVATNNDAQVAVRLSAEVPYTDAENNEGTMVTAPIIIYMRTVTLGLSIADSDWQMPKQVNGGNTLPSFNFTFQGSIAKTLHVEISNTNGEFLFTRDIPSISPLSFEYTPDDTAMTAGITNSGVHEIRAYITCSNGEGGTLVSDMIRHQFIVVNTQNTTGAMHPYVLLQGMETSVDNFVRSLICKYMVWNPKETEYGVQNDTSKDVLVRFLATNRVNLNAEHETYMSLPVTVRAGDPQELYGIIEVESDTVSNAFPAYLFALGYNDQNETISLLGGDGYAYFEIDNTAGFQPVRGATFQLNPKSRDNGEENSQTIINAKTGEVIESTWDGFKMDDSDGYTVDEDGFKVLRVPAGRKLTIGFNPFAYYYRDHIRPMTFSFEVQYRVRNVTNEIDPIFRAAEYQDNMNAWLGLMMRPIDGTMVTVASQGIAGETDFRWAEDRLEHLLVTVNYQVQPYREGKMWYNPNKEEFKENRINVVRVYNNGNIIREVTYNPDNDEEFCTALGAISNGIIIGQEGQDGRGSGADIDIYSIRFYETGLSMKQSLQNYISSLPSSDEKRRQKERNDILDDNDEVSIAKCHEKSISTFVMHVDELPRFGYSSSVEGWAEYTYYDEDGVYHPEYSGSFCKTTKKLSFKGQGTTAMTYTDWNQQGDMSKVKATITISPSQIHSSIVLGNPMESDGEWVVPIYGGCLGSNYPVGNGTKNYPCTVDSEGHITSITVPDGWIDGNGFYRGPCWQAGPGKPLSQKLVFKANYASSMQSHLIGVNWLYNELHTAYCGQNSLQQAAPASQVAKQVRPVLFFTVGKNVEEEQATLDQAVYQGPGGFGPGKMDKSTWGYSSKYSGHNYFAMLEGAANNTVLSDFLAPWDDQDLLDEQGNVIQSAKVKYFLHDPVSSSAKDPESFFYRHTRIVDGVVQDQWEKGIGFDAGKTGQSGATAEMPSTSSDSPDDAPAPNIMKVVRDAWNYVYMHNPKINAFDGTLDEFQQRGFTASELKQKWVIRESYAVGARFLLKRWDFCERRWVDAGLWNITNHAYDEINILEHSNSAENIANAVNDYKAWLITDAYPTDENHLGIGAFFKASSLRFHYAFINLFIAGTDNCSKNTYYVIDPVTHLIELHQDDVDTVLATDNNGYQSKPYYIDRTHPYPDGSNVSGYDGMQNGLFDLIESLWLDDANHSIAQTMSSILGLMANLRGGMRSAESENMSGVWKVLNNYLFDIQRYFPKVAYNEAARIRYEFAAAIGHTEGHGGTAKPLAQSMGDQLEAEIQFMKRRLIYFASYACFGEFSTSIAQSRPSIGIPDVTAAFQANLAALPNGGNPSYKFTLKPHQYIYPCFYINDQNRPSYVRLAPDATENNVFEFNNLSVNPDYTIALPALNYYHSIGNVGDMSGAGDNFALSLQGTRMTEFVAEPSYYYPTAGGERITAEYWAALPDEQKVNYLPAYRPKSVSVSESYGATRLRKLSLKGCTTVSHSSALPMDLRRLVVAEEIDLRGTNVAAVRLPQTSTLTTLRLPAGITTLRLENLPSLTTVSLEGGANVESLYISNVGSFGGSGSYTLFDGIYNDQTSERKMSSLVAYGINWNGVSANQVRWMLATSTLDLKGSIAVSGTIPFVRVVELMDKFGNILDPNNATDSLYVSYTKTPITSPSISGAKDVRSVGTWTGWSVAVGSGNNIGVRQLQNGKYAPHITWSLSERDINDSADSSYYATLTDDNKGYFNVEHVENAFEYTEWNEGKYAWDDVPHKEFELTVNIVTTDSQTITVTKKVRFANRAPHVGDFAWHDGTFDNEVDGSKKLVGTVIMRELEYQTPADPVSSNNPPVSVKCWVYAKENASIQSNLENDTAPIGSPTPTAAMSWGVYNDNNNSNGFSQSVLDDANNGLFAGTGLTHAQVTNVYGSTDDISTRSVPATDDAYMTEKPSQAAGTYCKFIDQAEFDGYMKFTSGALADFDTEIRNTRILDVANAVINRFIIPEDNGIDAAPRTPTELANAMRKLELKHHVSATEARYYQFFYPAAYACHVYTPIGVDDSMLDEQYKQGHWMLPSEGLLARIFNFKYNSMGRPKTTAGSAVSGSISTSYANENPSKESLLPLFANLMKRINDTPSVIDRPSFDYPGTSGYWSSAEYNTPYAWTVYFYSGLVYYNSKYYTNIVARGVAAYHFSLNP